AWGADGAKPGKPAVKAAVKPPEVVRTDDHEDVDGRTRKSEAPPGPSTAPELRPADLDALIAKSLLASKTEPSPITTDEEFIRRLYLDVLGRLPNPGAIREFGAARQRDK